MGMDASEMRVTTPSIRMLVLRLAHAILSLVGRKWKAAAP